MPVTRQSSLSFPVRKTRVTKGEKGIDKNVTKTPTKSKIDLKVDKENSPSPPKKNKLKEYENEKGGFVEYSWKDLNSGEADLRTPCKNVENNAEFISNNNKNVLASPLQVSRVLNFENSLKSVTDSPTSRFLRKLNFESLNSETNKGSYSLQNADFGSPIRRSPRNLSVKSPNLNSSQITSPKKNIFEAEKVNLKSSHRKLYLESPVRRSPRKLNADSPLYKSEKFCDSPRKLYDKSFSNNFPIKANLENLYKSPNKTPTHRSQKKVNIETSVRSSPRKCLASGKRNSSPKKATLSNQTTRVLSSKALQFSPRKENFKSLEKSPKIPIASSSPRKTCLKNSGVTLLNSDEEISFPLKSNTNSINHSPRKISSPICHSPKKKNFHTPAIRSSPRKLSAISYSPTSLVSRLSLKSPVKNVPNLQLQKPDVKLYRALKSALSCGSDNEIVGREMEEKFLRDFLTKHLKQPTSGSLYVSGAPGTGKTVLITKIIENLNMKFTKIFLNCMMAASSKDIFVSIAKKLSIKVKKTENEIIQQIEKSLVSSKKPILMILDEMDQLESKNQNVLYTIFEWPSLNNSKLILVGIANMLDLTDRILPRLQSIQSSKPKLLHFSAYSKTEIAKIINKRIENANLGDVEIIKPSAIQFLAGKISSVSGDIRKALDVCRRAVEIQEMEARKQLRLAIKSPAKSPSKRINPVLKKVEIPHILAILNEIFGNRVANEISKNSTQFPLHQKIVLCSLLLMLKSSKTKNVSLGALHEVYKKVCSRQKLPSVDQSEFFSLCSLLDSRGIFQVKKNKEFRNSKVILRVNEIDATTALNDKTLLSAILQDTKSLYKLSHRNL